MSTLSLHDFYDCHLYAFSIASELYLRVQISENIHSCLLCHGKQLRIILKFKVQLSNTLSFKEVISSINKSFNNLPPKIWFNRLHQLWLIIFKYFKKFSYVRKLLVYLGPSHIPNILSLKLQLLSNYLFPILVSDSCVKVKKGQDPTDVNNG